MNRIFYFLLISFLIFGCKKDNTSLVNKAYDLEQRGEFEKAIVILTEAIKINPMDLDCYNNRAWDYYDIGDNKSALKDFEEMLKIDSINTAAIYGIGFINYKEEKYRIAIDHFNRVIEIEDDKPKFIFRKLGEEEKEVPFGADMKKVYHFKSLAQKELSKKD